MATKLFLASDAFLSYLSLRISTEINRFSFEQFLTVTSQMIERDYVEPLLVEAAQITMDSLHDRDCWCLVCSYCSFERPPSAVHVRSCAQQPYWARRDCCSSWLDIFTDAGMIGLLVTDPRRYACKMGFTESALPGDEAHREGVMRPSNEPMIDIRMPGSPSGA